VPYQGEIRRLKSRSVYRWKEVAIAIVVG
jgi:hypothetical protein